MRIEECLWVEWHDHPLRFLSAVVHRSFVHALVYTILTGTGSPLVHASDAC